MSDREPIRPRVIDAWNRAWPCAWFVFGAAGTLFVVAMDTARAFADFDETAVVALFFMPMFGVTLLMMMVPWLLSMLFNALGGRWRCVLAALVAPAVGLALPYALLKSGLSPRFLIERPRMERAVAAMGGIEGHGYDEFPWNSSGFPGSDTIEETMIYDATDTIAQRVASRSTSWPAGSTVVTPMGWHFFLLSQDLSRN